MIQIKIIPDFPTGKDIFATLYIKVSWQGYRGSQSSSLAAEQLSLNCVPNKLTETRTYRPLNELAFSSTCCVFRKLYFFINWTFILFPFSVFPLFCVKHKWYLLQVRSTIFFRYFLPILVSRQTQMRHIKKECSNTNWDRTVRIYGDRALPFPQGRGVTFAKTTAIGCHASARFTTRQCKLFGKNLNFKRTALFKKWYQECKTNEERTFRQDNLTRYIAKYSLLAKFKSTKICVRKVGSSASAVRYLTNC